MLTAAASQNNLQGQPASASQIEIKNLGQHCAHSPNEKNKACTDLAGISADTSLDLDTRVAAARNLALQGMHTKGNLDGLLEKLATNSDKLPVREAALKGISIDELVKIAMSMKDQMLGAGIVNAVGDKGAGDCFFPNCFGLDEQRRAMRALTQIAANAETPEVRVPRRKSNNRSPFVFLRRNSTREARQERES